MHEICAFVTIIHPGYFRNIVIADVAPSSEIAMFIWNGEDKMERVMVISRLCNDGRRESTLLVDPEITGDAYIRKVFSLLPTSITFKQSLPLQ